MKVNRIVFLTLAIIIFTMSFVWAKTPTAFDKQMDQVLEVYLPIIKILSEDKTEGITAAAKKISQLAGKLDFKGLDEDKLKKAKKIKEDLITASNQMASAKKIDQVRETLKELSKPFARWVSLSAPEGVSVMYCSMAKGSWLQKNDTTISNPYYGSKMLRCGEIVAGFGKGKMDGHMKH